MPIFWHHPWFLTVFQFLPPTHQQILLAPTSNTPILRPCLATSLAAMLVHPSPGLLPQSPNSSPPFQSSLPTEYFQDSSWSGPFQRKADHITVQSLQWPQMHAQRKSQSRCRTVRPYDTICPHTPPPTSPSCPYPSLMSSCAPESWATATLASLL